MNKSPFFIYSLSSLLLSYIGIPSPTIFFIVLGLTMKSNDTNKILPSNVVIFAGSQFRACFRVKEWV